MSSIFDYDIKFINGIGAKRALLFEKLGAPTAGDLLRLYPRNYEDWRNHVSISHTILNEINVVKASILSRPVEQKVKGGMLLYKVSASDDESNISLTFFNNKYIPQLLRTGQTYYFRGKVTGTTFRHEMVSPEFYTENKAMQVLPIYSQTSGLTSRQITNTVKECLKLIAQDCPDPLKDEIRDKYKLCHLNYALQNIHLPLNPEAIEIARRRLIFEELLVLQLGLRQIRSRNNQQKAHEIKEEYLDEFKGLIPFSLTAAQERSINECIHDMKKKVPMNRLLQGDVGSGKTAVAAALCLTAIREGMQAAMMAPTEILAMQHYNSLSALLKPAGINVGLLTGSTTAKNKRLTYEALQTGKINLIIGTHALISEGVYFDNLGLIITDEQHRFGVEQRSALAKKAVGPHLLVMTATPIPRTLALMIYSDLDVSVLDELPLGRQPIKTYHIDSSKRLRAFKYIQKHLDEGRQGFIICPLVEEGISDLASVTAYSEFLKSYFPENITAVLHGKMKPKEKEAIMGRFVNGEIKLLISTTVVEVGVDVPNAVIMLIENAERYGLSQLHQLRGRVGRGQHASTCILLSDAQNEESITRMKIMCATTDGFKIADEDLLLRGPGDFFGQRQHGLPRLKIADMVNDMDTLREAQSCAAEILAGDPTLLNHMELAEEIRRLFYRSGNDNGMIL